MFMSLATDEPFKLVPPTNTIVATLAIMRRGHDKFVAQLCHADELAVADVLEQFVHFILAVIGEYGIPMVRHCVLRSWTRPY
jgi:hypothetical protein